MKEWCGGRRSLQTLPELQAQPSGVCGGGVPVYLCLWPLIALSSGPLGCAAGAPSLGLLAGSPLILPPRIGASKEVTPCRARDAHFYPYL